MTKENSYNMPPKGLFGKRCRIKHCSNLERGFVYRIVNDGVCSNTWRELPLGRFGKEPVLHDTFEEVVFVVCDTLIDESSKIEKVALKDIEIIEEQLCDKCVYSTSEGCQYDDITETIPPFEDCISRQAAIDALSHMMDTDGFRDGWAVSRANVDCMLRSLPPVTPQLCEDAVSRKAVLKYIEGSEAELGHSSENELVCQDIKELPPVTPQPKMGHWIGRGGSYICSCCRCDPLDFLEPEGLDGGSYMDTPMNYCPHCGIKMVEPQAESEK